MNFQFKRVSLLLVVLLLTCLFVNFGSTAVFAGVSSNTTTQQDLENRPFPADSAPAAQPTVGFAWGSFVLTVVLFIILLVGLSFLVKRLNQAPALSSPWLKVLDRQQIGPGHHIYLVELAGKLQILGVTGQSMVKIADIDDIELAGEILQDLAFRAEQVVDPWWSQLFSRIKDSSFAQQLGRNSKGEKW